MNDVPNKLGRLAVLRGSARLLAGATLLSVLCVLASDPAMPVRLMQAAAGLLFR